jgi:hypothetical protein
MGHRYDVITDEDLHAEGLQLSAYKVVLTRPSRVPEPGDDGRADGLLERGGG